MRDTIKLRLRLTTDAFNDQIDAYITECKMELELQGVVNISDSDPMVISCCEAYAKYKFNYEGGQEWYYRRFTMLRDSMSKMQKYYITRE